MSAPDIGPAERAAVDRVLRGHELSNGPQLVLFERLLAQFLGAGYAVGVSNGTNGLHACVVAAGIADGDLVLTTPYTFVATGHAICYERALPVFVDVDPLTGNIDPALVAEAVADIKRGGAWMRRWLPPMQRSGAISGRLKALLPVHVYGQPADMDPLLEVAHQYDLLVIEDACESLGTLYKGRPAGALGDMAVFGFYPNKQITGGEGGAIVSNDQSCAELCRSLRNHGRDPEDAALFVRFGFNYRLDEIRAAVLATQMSRIEEILVKRALVAAWYSERLTGLERIQLPVIAPTTTHTSWFVYTVRVQPPLQRSVVIAALNAANIPSRVYFSPIHLYEHFRAAFGYKPGDFPIAERLGEVSLALPFSGVMTEEQVDRVCDVIRSVAK